MLVYVLKISSRELNFFNFEEKIIFFFVEIFVNFAHAPQNMQLKKV